ncbi:MAG: GspE/PulE family protein [Patescibacteria group bacterium]
MADEKTTALDRKLEKLSRASEERVAQKLAQDLSFPYVDLGKTPVSLEAIKLVPEVEAKAARAAAIEIRVNKVALAAVDPRVEEVKSIIKSLEAKRLAVKVFVGSFSGIKQAWHLYGFVPPEASDITGKIGIEKKRFEELIKKWNTLDDFKKELGQINLEKETTSHIFEMVLAEAMAARASDIHFEAEEEKARIRFRIDGLLHDAFSDFPLKSYGRLVSRIKLLAGMKINVRGEPQDGRFTISLTNKDIEVRVSIIPSQFGETIVMRVLDPDAIGVTLEELGLRPDDLKIVERQLEKPNGLVLNTGPTGSGKTTTLYAFLKHLSNPETKIITIEDPIEYRIEGIEQTQVDPSVEYTFAKGLRAIVRQDPDVVLVGEIRDLETAEIAMQAALTGHTVFSTLHTNDAVGAVPRLYDLGVKPAIIGPALSLIIAQRLVRQLCNKCKKLTEVSAEEKKKFSDFLEKLPPRVDKKPYESFSFYEPVGCSVCQGFGYRGRIGVFEFLEAGPEFESVILKEISEVTLKKLAGDQKMVTMQQDGILKVLKGMTTLEEVEKVTGPVDWLK